MSGWSPINFYTATFSPASPGDMQPSHAGQASILGEDSKRYAVIQINPVSGSSHYPVVYCYDTNATLFYGASEGFSASLTQMQADLTTLALSGAPASSNFTWINETFAIANTAQFIVMGSHDGLSGSDLAFIRYKINASSAIELVDGFIVRCSATQTGRFHVINLQGTLNQSTLVDCRIIGSTLYIAGSGISAASQNEDDTILLSFPLTIFGTCDITVGSYDAYVTILAHGPMFLWPFNPSYVNGQRGQIVEVGSVVGLLAYAGAGAIRESGYGNQFFAGGAEYNGKPRLIFSGGTTAFTDYGATFGVPFSDTLFNFAGALTTNINNDYNGPSLITKGGDTFAVFTRIYNDNNREMRMRVFSWPDGAPQLDFTETFWNLGYFPATPDSFSPVNVFYSPDGSGDLILQSDVLNQASTGSWRLYADFGRFPPSGPGGAGRNRWLAELGPIKISS